MLADRMDQYWNAHAQDGNFIASPPARNTTFLRWIDLPEAMADWPLTSLQLKLIKIGARVVRHARAITFQLAEVAVTGPMVRAILAAIRRLRAPPQCA